MTPAMAKAALFYVRLEKKKQIYTSMASTQIRQQTPFMVKIFLVMHVIMHFPMNCKLYFQLNQLLVNLVPAQVWRVIFNKSEHRKFVLVLLQYLCTAACKAVNVKGNTW